MAKAKKIEPEVWHQVLNELSRLTDENCSYLNELLDVISNHIPQDLIFEFWWKKDPDNGCVKLAIPEESSVLPIVLEPFSAECERPLFEQFARIAAEGSIDSDVWRQIFSNLPRLIDRVVP